MQKHITTYVSFSSLNTFMLFFLVETLRHLKNKAQSNFRQDECSEVMFFGGALTQHPICAKNLYMYLGATFP